MVNKKRSMILVIFLVVGLVGGIVALTAAAATPLLPGITSKDDRPNGCVDCHKKDASGDTLLTTVLKQVKGHPDVSKIVKKVPTDCALCHKGGAGKTPSIAQVAHEVHYKNAATNAFVTSYGGQCLNCHSLTTDTGVMIVKSAAANW